MSSSVSAYLSRHRKKVIDKILRVNHAGELGADRIYCGQVLALRSLGSSKINIVQQMWNQEKHHLETFEKLIVKNRSKKSLLIPFWNVSGFLLGYVSGKLGSKVAMATTVAIEKVITEHYDNQLRILLKDEHNLTENKELIDIIKNFRNEEQEHYDKGMENDAKNALFYNIINNTVQLISKISIKIAEKI